MNNQIIEQIVYDDALAIDTIKKYINDSPNGWNVKLRFNKQLVEYINSRFPLLSDKFYTIGTKVYWLFNGLTTFPTCAYCGKELKLKNVYLAGGYSDCCCNEHAQKWHFQNLSESEKEVVRNHGRNWAINKTKEEMQEIVKKSIDAQKEKYGDIYTRTQEGKEKSIAWMKTKTQEELDEISKRKSESLKQWRNTMSDEDKQNMLKKQKEYWVNLSETERKQISEQRRESVSNWWKNMPLESRKQLITKMTESIKRHYQNMTKEQHDKLVQKRIAFFQQETEDHKRTRIQKMMNTMKNKSSQEKLDMQIRSQQNRAKNFKKTNRPTADGYVFDVIPELKFYLKCKSLGYDIQPHPKQVFSFLFDGKIKHYFPDFLVNGHIVEIKGDMFFRRNEHSEQEEMFLPWKGKLSDEEYNRRCRLQEAKHQCMKQNGVIIIRSSIVDQYDYSKLASSCLHTIKNVV